MQQPTQSQQPQQLAHFQDYSQPTRDRPAAGINGNMPVMSRYPNSENFISPLTLAPSGWNPPPIATRNDPRYNQTAHHPPPLIRYPLQSQAGAAPHLNDHPSVNTGFSTGSLSNPLVISHENQQSKYPVRTRDQMKQELARSLASDSNVSCLPGYKHREPALALNHPPYRQDQHTSPPLSGQSRRKFFPNQNQFDSSNVPRRFSHLTNSSDFPHNPSPSSDLLYRSYTTSSIPSTPFPPNYPHHLTFPVSSSLSQLNLPPFTPRPLPDSMANQFGLPAKFRARNEKTGTWLSMGTPGSSGDTSLQEAKAIKEGYRQELEKQIEQARLRREEEIRRERDINDHPLGSHYAQHKSYFQPKHLLAPPNLTALDTANKFSQDQPRTSEPNPTRHPTTRLSSTNPPSSVSQPGSVKPENSSGLAPSTSLSQSTASPISRHPDPNSGTRIIPSVPSTQSPSWPIYLSPSSGPPLPLGPLPPPPHLLPYPSAFLPPHPLQNYFPPHPPYPPPIHPSNIPPIPPPPRLPPHPSPPLASHPRSDKLPPSHHQINNSQSQPRPSPHIKPARDFLPSTSRNHEDTNPQNRENHRQREENSAKENDQAEEDEFHLRHYTGQTSDQLPDPALKTMIYKNELRRQIIQKQKDSEERANREREEDEKLERRIREHEERMRREVAEEQRRFYQKTGLKDLIWRLDQDVYKSGGGGGKGDGGGRGERERREGVIKEKAKYGIHLRDESKKTSQPDPYGFSPEHLPPPSVSPPLQRRYNTEQYEQRIREKCNKSRDDNSSDFHPPPDDATEHYGGYPLPPDTPNPFATQSDSSFKAKLQQQLLPHNGQGDNQQISQPLSHILDSLNMETLRMERVIRRKMNL